jgi:hypothetical protein
MKKVISGLLVMFVAILCVMELRAQNRPFRTPDPTVAVGSTVAQPGAGGIDPGMPGGMPVEIKMHPVTWLGVQTREVSPEVYEHAVTAGLTEGIGVVVEFIEPNSPAAKAGVARLDIITKFADQMLINPQQLDTLVRMRHTGEEVELTVVHKGRSQKTRVVLGKTEVPENDFGYPVDMMPGSSAPMRFPMMTAPGSMSMPDTMIDQSVKPRSR